MAGIDEVLERLVTDAGFRTQLQEDPRSALEGYVLYDEDLEVLAATLDEGEVAEHGVEQRTSKSAFLSAFLIGGSGGGGSAGSTGELAAPPGSDGDAASRSQCSNNLKQLGIAIHGEEGPADLAAPETAAQNDDGAGTWTEHNDTDPGVGREPEGTPADDFPDLAQQPPSPQEGSEAGASAAEHAGTAPSDLAAPGEPEEATMGYIKFEGVDGEATDAPPSDEFTGPPDGGDASMTKSELTQPLARPSSDGDAPTDDLAPGDAVEETVQPTYPGVYVEEVPSAESGAVPPDASLSSAEAEQPSPEGWPAKWSGPESSEETTSPTAPHTDPPDLVAEQQTEEAETVHAFLKANGSDLQGESTEPGEPDDPLEGAAGPQDTDR